MALTTIPGFTPYIDFSPLGELPKAYWEGQAHSRQNAFIDALQQQGGLPMKNGVVDWDAATNMAARYGALGNLEQFGKLGETSAARRETKRYHDILASQVNKPVIHWNPVDPRNPGAPQTGIAIITDKNGNMKFQAVTAPAAPGQKPAAAPDTGGGGNPFEQPPGSLDSVIGNQSAAPPIEPPSPVAAAEGSPSDAMIAQAQRAMAGQAPPQAPPAQFAQARGGPVVDFGDSGPGAPAPPPARPPARPAAPVLPPWAVGAQMRGSTARPEPEAPNPLGPEQRGELRFQQPLGPFNEAAIAGLPEAWANKVRAVATGRMSITKAASITGGERAALSNDVLAYNPGWSESLFLNRQKALNGLADTRGSSPGAQVKALNNLTEHLVTADELLRALNNGQIPIVNALINKGRELTGYKAELPGNVKAAAGIIAGELMKVIAGQGGGVGERAEAAHNLLKTNAPPAAQIGAIGTVKKLMLGQLHGLEQWYENNTYNTDFRKKWMSPAARKLAEQMEAEEHGGGGAPGGGDYKILNVR